jgi:hypothetical protein
MERRKKGKKGRQEEARRIKIKTGEKEREEGLLLLVQFPVLWVIIWQSV